MNIDDQAELAFKHHIDNYGIDWGSDCELFTAGYRAALRPFALNPGEWIAMDNSEPPQVWVWYGDRDESAEPVRRLSLPCPSTIFGEEV